MTGPTDGAEAGKAPRPRDELGRPLERGASGVPEVPPEPLPPEETLATAQRYWDMGRAFAAHEVLEARWKASPAEERDLWQGLAQLAVGYTHLQRGNLVGGARLLRRGSDRMAPWVAGAPYRIDVAGLVAWARQLAAAVDDGQLTEPLDRHGRNGRDGQPGGGGRGGPSAVPRLGPA
jgi:hypothetical protein